MLWRGSGVGSGLLGPSVVPSDIAYGPRSAKTSHFASLESTGHEQIASLLTNITFCMHAGDSFCSITCVFNIYVPYAY